MTPRTWLITGTNRGFGRLLTELLLERGERVAATTRHPEELDALVAKFPDNLWVRHLDVADPEEVRNVVKEAFSFFGRIDVIANNAGYLLFGAAEELEDTDISRQVATNLMGSIQMVRAVLPFLRQQGGGRIIQYSSMVGQSALPALGVYQATKWGIEGFLEAVMLEVAPFNIQITLVEPGFTKTGLSGGANVQRKVIPAYQETTVGNFRRLLASGRFPCPGDATRVAQAIIASADQEKAPKRLVLGSDAYASIHKALTGRIEELEAQKEAALATDKNAAF